MGARSSRVQEGNFTLQELVEITRNFTDEIGAGGFGTVYRGTLGNKQDVAVKMIRINVGDRNDEVEKFNTEVKILMGLEHENIVRLIGYCYDAKQIPERRRYLCFEYLPNGDLHRTLEKKSDVFDWRKHFQIIMGISAGVRYLHTPRGQQGPVIHLDLKPDNILLDENMKPKITDFGLSRLFGVDQTRHFTQFCVGATGYMAPEYLKHGQVSIKNDIYSLGVLILETVTGQKAQENPRTKARQFCSQMSEIESRYGSLNGEDVNEINRCIEVGIRCLEEDPTGRPTAAEINKMLSGEIPLGHVLLAKELDLLHSNSDKYWTWHHEVGSRFEECAFLKEVWFFHVAGMIATNDLINDATYKVYLIYKLEPAKDAKDASGFEGVQSAEITFSNCEPLLTSRVCLNPGNGDPNPEVAYPVNRRDGWKEINLGSFENSIQTQGKNVTVTLSEKTVYIAKKGLHVGAMEFRPC